MPFLTAKASQRRGDLPIHFFTIVLNGEPFIRYHLGLLRELPFRWHWHVVEGVASLVHDTAWSLAGDGYVDPGTHQDGLSIDGTTEYLDEIAAADPDRISIYRRSEGFWDGKLEMVSAPLANIREECLLWQVDADELWTAEQVTRMRDLFIDKPERTAAYYWCDYFVGPEAVLTTRYNYAQDPNQDWLRTWRFQPGDRWEAHEPPTLVRPHESGVDVGKARPFGHDETEREGAVFQHYAYVNEKQLRFKESYYGYKGALEAWRTLQSAIKERGPVRLGDYLPWVPDDTLADDVSRTPVEPLARCEDGTWTFSRQSPELAPDDSAGSGSIVVDGVFFQDFSTTGIARVWQSLLHQWLESGFADRVVFLERDGCGPRLPGLRTRSLPRWTADRSAEDALHLQRICDAERASLFVSSYYTAPIGTPSLMLVYDMIPERLGLDMSDPVWDEKRRTIEHASSYACISENTRRDLLELEPVTAGRPADVVLLGVEPAFSPATEDEVAAFRREYNITRPYILTVGERRGVDGYKNGELVFRAFDGWHAADECEIVCVGGHEEIEPELRRAAPRASVRRLDLTDAELRLAYAAAIALAYPSRYEGFGLPIAEAMASGCPVIATAVASVPEVAGDAAIYVDPDDPRELAAAFDAVREPTRRAAMIAAGLDRAAAFEWQRAAAAFASLLDEAAQPEAPEDRNARALDWQGRRELQAHVQARQRATRSVAPPPAVRDLRSRLSRRLTTLALRHLPPGAVRRLRTLKSTLTRGRGIIWRLRNRVRALKRQYVAMRAKNIAQSLRKRLSPDRTYAEPTPASGSELDHLIPPEIKSDPFAEIIEAVAATPGVREILEIGSSAGDGSTEAWVRGARRNAVLPRLHCIELSTERFAALAERWRGDAFVHCYNVSSVPLEQFPSAEEVERFYRDVPSQLRNFELDMVLGWLKQDMDYLEKHKLSTRGIGQIKEQLGIETFDAVLIDGSEFTGSAELDEVYGARFILLDDTETFKNWKNMRRLEADPRYRLVQHDPSTRNGFAVFQLAG
jgi:glycosyltransferase involved in cell wall biosynthesis